MDKYISQHIVVIALLLLLFRIYAAISKMVTNDHQPLNFTTSLVYFMSGNNTNI